jgi:hypothetical protein
MHQAAIRSLGIVEDRIRGKGLEAKLTSCKEGRKKEFKLRRNEYSESSEEERSQKRKEDARNIIAQA